MVAVEGLDAVGNATVRSDFDICDYVRTVAVAALEEAHNLDLGLCSLVLGPLSEHAAALFNGLGEIDLVGFLLLVGVVRVVSMPIPTGEGVALAGGCRRLRHEALGVGQTPLNFLTVSELAAVSEERDVSLVLILLLVGLVVNIKRSDAFEGGGHIHFDCAGCDARDDRLGGITLDLALDAIRNIAACRNLDNGGLAGAITVAANEVADNLNALGCVLLPCSKPVAGLRGSRLKLVIHLLVCRNLAHIRLRVPTREAIASTSGRGEIDPFAFVCLNRGHDLTISELAAISNKIVHDASALLCSSAIVALASIVSESYCRHATENKRQAQACCYCFLRTRILHLFSFLLCISLRPAHMACLPIHASEIKQPPNKNSLRNIRRCIFLHNRYTQGITCFVSSMKFFASIYTLLSRK